MIDVDEPFSRERCGRCGGDEMDSWACDANDCEFAILGRYRDEHAEAAHGLKAAVGGEEKTT